MWAHQSYSASHRHLQCCTGVTAAIIQLRQAAGSARTTCLLLLRSAFVADRARHKPEALLLGSSIAWTNNISPLSTLLHVQPVEAVSLAATRRNCSGRRARKPAAAAADRAKTWAKRYWWRRKLRGCWRPVAGRPPGRFPPWRPWRCRPAPSRCCRRCMMRRSTGRATREYPPLRRLVRQFEDSPWGAMDGGGLAYRVGFSTVMLLTSPK